MATTVEKKTILNQVETFKTGVKDLNDRALTTSAQVIEGAVVAGEAWQNVLGKALVGGVKLMGRQQEMTLSALEMVKTQYATGNQRFRKLIGWNTWAKRRVKKAATKKVELKKATPASIDEVLTAAEQAEVVANVIATTEIPLVKDNLKLIDGIGPKMEQLLNEAGIQTFQQLATASNADLKNILESAGSRYKMFDPTTWNDQATLAAAGQLDELKALQQALKAAKK